MIVGTHRATVAELVAAVSAGATSSAGPGMFDGLLQAADRVRELPDAAVPDLMVALERHGSAVLALQMRVFADFARPGRAGDAQMLAEQTTSRRRALATPSGEATLDAVADQIVDDLADTARRLAVAEVAARMNIAHITAGKRLDQALAFTGEGRRGFWAQLRAGVLDRGRAITIDDELSGLTVQQQAHVDDALADRVAGKSNAELRTLIRRQIVLMDPEAAEKKGQEALKGRRVLIFPAPDNMAAFKAILPADAAMRAFTFLDTCSPRFGPGDDRCVDQRRADTFDRVFTSLAIDGAVTVGQLLGNTTGPAGGNPEQSDSSAGPNPNPSADPDPDPNPNPNPSADPDPNPNPNPSPGPNPSPDPRAREGADADGSAPASANLAAGESAIRREAPGWTETPGSTLERLRSTRRQGREVTLHVHLSLATLLALDNNPGTLDGYGTITAGYARALAESAGALRLVLTDPATGFSLRTGRSSRIPPHRVPPAPIPLGRQRRSQKPGTKKRSGPTGAPAAFTAPSAAGDGYRYRPSQTLRDDVTATWTHCTFPRCRQPSWRGDLDHRQAFHHDDPTTGGATVLENMQPLCRGHHLLKTFTDWDCVITADGTIEWTSPTGHHYPVHPDVQVCPDEWNTREYSPPPSPEVTPWMPGWDLSRPSVAPHVPGQGRSTNGPAHSESPPSDDGEAAGGRPQATPTDTNGWPEDPPF